MAEVAEVADKSLEARVLDAFQKFDSNRDGTISKAELSSVFEDLDGSNWPAERIDTVFTAMDVDADGKLSYMEFLAWVFNANEHEEMSLDASSFISVLEMLEASVDGNQPGKLLRTKSRMPPSLSELIEAAQSGVKRAKAGLKREVAHAIKPGMPVAIFGFDFEADDADLNGKKGTAMTWMEDQAQWSVQLSPDSPPKAISPKHLAPMTGSRVMLGSLVVVSGLENNDVLLNGQVGTVLEWDHAEKAWTVRLPDGENRTLPDDQLLAVQERSDSGETVKIKLIQPSGEEIGEVELTAGSGLESVKQAAKDATGQSRFRLLLGATLLDGSEVVGQAGLEDGCTITVVTIGAPAVDGLIEKTGSVLVNGPGEKKNAEETLPGPKVFAVLIDAVW